jgi:hypothetical protein
MALGQVPCWVGWDYTLKPFEVKTTTKHFSAEDKMIQHSNNSF